MKTSKKLVSLLAIMALAMSLCACSSKVEDVPTDKPALEEITEAPQDTEQAQPTEQLYKPTEEELVGYKVFAEDLYDQNHPYLLYYDTYALPGDGDDTGSPEFEWVTEYAENYNIGLTPSEIRAASGNDKLLHYRLAVLYDFFHEEKVDESRTVWYKLKVSDYPSPYSSIYLKDAASSTGDEYGKFCSIAEGIPIDGKKMSIIDGYLTYSGDEVPLEDIVLKTECQVTVINRQGKYKEDRNELVFFIERPFTELTADGYKFPYDKIDRTYSTYYTEVSGNPVVFTRQVGVNYLGTFSSDFNKTGYIQCEFMPINAVSLSDIPLSEIIRGFSFDTTDKVKKCADYIGFEYHGIYFNPSFVFAESLDNNGNLIIENPVTNARVTFQLANDYDPESDPSVPAGVYDAYRDVVNETKFYCLDVSGDKTEIGFADYAPEDLTW